MAVALMMVLCTAIPVSAKSRTPKKLYLKTTTTVVDIGGKTKVSVKKTKPSKASRSVRWKSSNKKIAVVSSKGVVTGKKKGTVRITATSKRNRRIRKSITVKVKDLKSTSLKLNRKQVTLGNKEAVTLKATLKGPKGYCNRGVVWKSSNPAIVSVSKSGKLTVKGTGSASVTAQEKRRESEGDLQGRGVPNPVREEGMAESEAEGSGLWKESPAADSGRTPYRGYRRRGRIPERPHSHCGELQCCEGISGCELPGRTQRKREHSEDAAAFWQGAKLRSGGERRTI